MAEQDARSPISTMFTCKKVKDTIACYRDILGFRLDEAWPDKSDPRWARLSPGSQIVMLGGTMSEAELNSPQCAHASPEERDLWRQQIQEFREHRPGGGVMSYFSVAAARTRCSAARLMASNPIL